MSAAGVCASLADNSPTLSGAWLALIASSPLPTAVEAGGVPAGANSPLAQSTKAVGVPASLAVTNSSPALSANEWLALLESPLPGRATVEAGGDAAGDATGDAAGANSPLAQYTYAVDDNRQFTQAANAVGAHASLAVADDTALAKTAVSTKRKNQKRKVTRVLVRALVGAYLYLLLTCFLSVVQWSSGACPHPSFQDEYTPDEIREINDRRANKWVKSKLTCHACPFVTNDSRCVLQHTLYHSQIDTYRCLVCHALFPTHQACWKHCTTICRY